MADFIKRKGGAKMVSADDGGLMKAGGGKKNKAPQFQAKVSQVWDIAGMMRLETLNHCLPFAHNQACVYKRRWQDGFLMYVIIAIE